MDLVSKIKLLLQNWIWTILIFFLIAGLFFPIVGIVALVCMTAPILYGYLKGTRIWCGGFCPRGHFLGKIIAQASLKNKIPRFLSNKKIRYTIMFILLILFTIGLIKAWGNYSTVGFVFVRMIIITTVIAIGLGIKYQPRTWCTICPMGTLSTIAIKTKKFTHQKSH